ncbi:MULTISPECIES: DUF362 domain-containing protein [unclassified Paenibacillus]|nr:MULTISPECIES: DUF362 domain-containing protein [unclassified Paenibacillus]
MEPNVKVACCRGNDRIHNLRSALAHLEQPFAEVNNYILVKPNFLSIRNKEASTNIMTLETILQFIRERYSGEIVLAEGAHCANEWFQSAEIKRLQLTYRLKCFCIDTDETRWQERNLEATDETVRISQTVADSDFRISLAIPKTHMNSGLSLSLKNMMGTVHPEDRGLFHGFTRDTLGQSKRKIHEQDSRIGEWFAKLVSLRNVAASRLSKVKPDDEVLQAMRLLNRNFSKLGSIVPPHLSIIDGFEAMEGDGPWHGGIIPFHTCIASAHYLAADLTAASLMGFKSDFLFYQQYLDMPLRQFNLRNIQLLGNMTWDNAYRFKIPSNLKTYEHSFYLS